MNRIFFAVCVFSICCLAPYSAFAEQIGGGDLTFTPKNAAAVVFSHKNHVSAKSMKCTACHYKIFKMSQGSYKMDMGDLGKGTFCGTCHDGKKSFDVTDRKNCVRCHR